MRFVDAHIHLSDEEYSRDFDGVVREAGDSSVVALVSNSMDLRTSVRSLELAEKFRGRVYAAIGVHPQTVNGMTEDEFELTVDLIRKQRRNRSLVAVGEVGLDFKYMKVWDRQLKVFDSMLHLAEQLGLPVIVHSRGTTAQIVDMLPSYGVKRVLLHWFSSPLSALSKAVEEGFYVSEGAPTLYSDGIREVVRRVPIDRLLTETDGPVRFFKPPFRGLRTSPAFIPIIVNAVAELRKMPIEEVAERVACNFEDFFGVELKSNG